MTTPDLPQAAIDAAREAAVYCMEEHPRATRPWSCCITAGLAAALPLLGETTTQWAIAGHSMGYRREEDARNAARTIPGACVVHRSITTISGEWTEAPSE